jgi:hypothetical protein
VGTAGFHAAKAFIANRRPMARSVLFKISAKIMGIRTARNQKSMFPNFRKKSISFSHAFLLPKVGKMKKSPGIFDNSLQSGDSCNPKTYLFKKLRVICFS